MDIIKKLITGTAAASAMFFLLSLAGGIMIRFTPMPENWGYSYLIAALSVSCFVCCIYVLSHIGKAGLVAGAGISAVVIAFVIFAVYMIFDKGAETEQILRITYLIPVVSGMVGGIIGTNIKK